MHVGLNAGQEEKQPNVEHGVRQRGRLRRDVRKIAYMLTIRIRVSQNVKRSIPITPITLMVGRGSRSKIDLWYQCSRYDEERWMPMILHALIWVHSCVYW